MTAELLRRFTCDKCDLVVEVASTTQPPRWGRLVITEPPLASPAEASTVDLHLCEACLNRAYDIYVPAKERVR